MAIPNDMTKIADGLAKLEASNGSGFTAGVKAASRRLIRRSYAIEVPAVLANGDGGTAANVSRAVRMPTAGRIMGVTAKATVAATAHDSNYATLRVTPISTAGAAGNTAASRNTQIVGGGNIVAGVPYSLTVDTANSNNQFTAGQWLAANVLMTASGVAMGACSFTIDVEEESSDGYGA